MSSRTFPLVGGHTMRGTALDACGVPAWGDRAQIVSDGFVSVAVTANYDDGQAKEQKNARGEQCVYVPAKPTLTNLSLALTFCQVDPDFYTLVTGFPRIVDTAGNTIGFRTNRGVKPMNVAWALEVWADATGSLGCGPDGGVPYGYLVWPFLSGAKVGDYTIEDNTVTFTVNGAITRDGSGWGVGPYLVLPNADGDPVALSEAVDPLDHQWTLVTTIAPPEPTIGLVPLDDPDAEAATGATAGSPGHFTPTGGVRPYDLTALRDADVTAAPSTAWTTGQHVILGDGSKAFWDGDSWETGAAS